MSAAPVNETTGIQNSERPLKRRHSSSAPATEAKVPKPANKLIIKKPTGEEEEHYGKNGYFKAENGMLLGGKYIIIEHIATGGYGAVYMGKQAKSNKKVAVKVARCGTQSNAFSERELEFMEATKGCSNVVSLLDSFTVKGPHGRHAVMVFDMLGPDLFNILTNSNQRRLTVDRIKKFCRDILKGLDHLHNKCGILHLDLKPENLLMTIGDEEPGQTSYDIDLSDPSCPASLVIADLGLAAWTTEEVNRPVQNCEYRCPEASLKLDIEAPADMWSFGAIAYELATRRELFPCTHEHCPTDFEDIEVMMHYINPKLEPAKIQKWCKMSDHDASLFSDFLFRIMKATPDSRLTAKEALEHPFLMN